MRYQGLFRGGQRIFWVLCGLAIAAMVLLQLGKALKIREAHPNSQESCHFKNKTEQTTEEGRCDLQTQG